MPCKNFVQMPCTLGKLKWRNGQHNDVEIWRVLNATYFRPETNIPLRTGGHGTFPLFWRFSVLVTVYVWACAVNKTELIPFTTSYRTLQVKRKKIQFNVHGTADPLSQNSWLPALTTLFYQLNKLKIYFLQAQIVPYSTLPLSIAGSPVQCSSSW